MAMLHAHCFYVLLLIDYCQCFRVVVDSSFKKRKHIGSKKNTNNFGYLCNIHYLESKNLLLFSIILHQKVVGKIIL